MIIEERKVREAGKLVQLIDGSDEPDFQGDVDDGVGRWVTFCCSHSTFVHHQTLQAARNFVAVPSEWCEECRESTEVEDES